MRYNSSLLTPTMGQLSCHVHIHMCVCVHTQVNLLKIKCNPVNYDSFPSQAGMYSQKHLVGRRILDLGV